MAQPLQHLPHRVKQAPPDSPQMVGIRCPGLGESVWCVPSFLAAGKGLSLLCFRNTFLQLTPYWPEINECNHPIWP